MIDLLHLKISMNNGRSIEVIDLMEKTPALKTVHTCMPRLGGIVLYFPLRKRKVNLVHQQLLAPSYTSESEVR